MSYVESTGINITEWIKNNVKFPQDWIELLTWSY